MRTSYELTRSIIEKCLNECFAQFQACKHPAQKIGWARVVGYLCQVLNQTAKDYGANEDEVKRDLSTILGRVKKEGNKYLKEATSVINKTSLKEAKS